MIFGLFIALALYPLRYDYINACSSCSLSIVFENCWSIVESSALPFQTYGSLSALTASVANNPVYSTIVSIHDILDLSLTLFPGALPRKVLFAMEAR